MALFESNRSRDREEILGSDAATRALSVTAVENDFVTRVYENITWVYDLMFGPTLHQGRVRAIERMAIKSDLDLTAFLTQSDVKPVSIEKVNAPKIWSLITCIKN